MKRPPGGRGGQSRRPSPPGRRRPGDGAGHAIAGGRPRRDHGLGGEQVEGRQAVAELLTARRRRAKDVWVDAEAEPAPVLERIALLAAEARVPVRRVPRARLLAEARTEAPQGVLAHAQALPEAELDDVCRATAPGGGPPFLLLLDGVTDPQNLGALLRSAEGAGVSGVVVPRHRAVHVTPAVTKAAAGAVERVPMVPVGGLPAALVRARELGVWLVGLAPDASESLFGLTLADQPVGLVLGSEDKGLSRLVRQRCDALVGIPLAGTLPSLNVAAAGAVALFEVRRRRLGAG